MNGQKTPASSSHYKLCLFDDHTRCAQVIELDCDDEAGARRAAREHSSGRRGQLWDRGRLVEDFNPRG